MRNAQKTYVSIVRMKLLYLLIDYSRGYLSPSQDHGLQK